MSIILLDPKNAAGAPARRTLSLAELPVPPNQGLQGVPVWSVNPSGGLGMFPDTSTGMTCDILWQSAMLQTVTVTATPVGSTTPLTTSIQVQSLNPLAITTSPTLPVATVGSAYSQQMAASGGLAPYTWALASGTLPTGLTLSASGLLSGTPTVAGPSTFTIQATDSNANVITLAVTLTIGVALPLVTALTISVGPEH
jgi:hypothetical protein